MARRYYLTHKSRLRHLGHDVQVISRNYLPGLPDENVLEIARKERRTLIVADRDFGELIFHQRLVVRHRNFDRSDIM